MKGIAEGRFITSGKMVEVRLDIIYFEEGISTIVYCPALDLSGYGLDEAEAEASFRISAEEFFRYTINKGTLRACLTKLGWILNKNPRKKMIPPQMDQMLQKNRQFKSIFNNHSFRKTAKSISIPCAC